MLHAEEYGRVPELHEQVFQTIKIQLIALNFVQIRMEPTGEWDHETIMWRLTELGRRALFETMAIRTGMKTDESQLPEPTKVETANDFDDLLMVRPRLVSEVVVRTILRTHQEYFEIAQVQDVLTRHAVA